MFKHGKDVNAFRLTPKQAEELNSAIVTQPAEYTETNGKPDLRKFIIYAVKRVAGMELPSTQTNLSTLNQSVELSNKLILANSKISQLEKQLALFRSKVDIPQPTREAIELLEGLEAFRKETSNAFRECFKRDSLPDLEREQVMMLMLDYCSADPAKSVKELLMNAGITVTKELSNDLDNLQYPRPDISLKIFKQLIHEKGTTAGGDNTTNSSGNQGNATTNVAGDGQLHSEST